MQPAAKSRHGFSLKKMILSLLRVMTCFCAGAAAVTGALCVCTYVCLSDRLGRRRKPIFKQHPDIMKMMMKIMIRIKEREKEEGGRNRKEKTTKKKDPRKNWKHERNH